VTEVPIRELNQRTAQVLARVERGETVEITRHGRVIGRIVPAGDARPAGELDDWIADGRAVPATRVGRWVAPTGRRDEGPDAGRLVRELRDGERW
jgi:prevent-host-death family protein